ncbi:rhamnosyltransferase [Burkholderia sp. KK1]|nr:rhamnosyltransferase [Burkholderia sp. KK1]
MNAASVSHRTGAVVVFYEPDEACIERVNRLAARLHCVVIDNTPTARTPETLGLSPDIDYRANAENLGIATAINQGVEALICAGLDFAILFDQDSEPPSMLLTELPEILAASNASGERIALAGPAYEDARLGGVAAFVRFQWWKLRRIAPEGNVPIDVDFLISSGSCLNLRFWSAIGPMEDALFIDYVDLEWCVRARRLGFRVVGVPWVRLSHQLGGEPVRVLGRTYPMHGPLRHYYQFRNVIALIARSNMPATWKSTELMKLPGRVLIYCFFPNQRKQHLLMVWRGICDGLRRRLGPYRAR